MDAPRCCAPLKSGTPVPSSMGTGGWGTKDVEAFNCSDGWVAAPPAISTATASPTSSSPREPPGSTSDPINLDALDSTGTGLTDPQLVKQIGAPAWIFDRLHL